MPQAAQASVLPGLVDLKFPPGHDPSPLYLRLRGRGPVYEEGGDCWLLTRYEHVAAVLADPRFSSHRPRRDQGAKSVSDQRQAVYDLLGQQLLVADGQAHDRLHTLINPVLQARSYAMRAALSEKIEKLLDAMQNAERWDVVDHLASPLTLWGMAHMLGKGDIDDDQLQRLREWSDAYAYVASGFTAASALQRIMDMRAAFHQLLTEKRRTPGDNLLSTFAGDHGWRDDEERVVNAMMLFVAGTTTTVKAITHGVWWLLRHPKQVEGLRNGLLNQGDLRKRAAFIRPTIEALLQRVSPTRYVVRWATCDVDFEGHIIRAGQQVYLFLEGANDELCAEEGEFESYRRSRKPHLAFGATESPHYCPGAPLARFMLQYSLSAVLFRFPDLRLADTAPVWGKRICPP